MTPRVSIILTVYKRTQFLTQALDSVLSQTYTDYEVLVADDSGTAASCDIVQQYEGGGKVRYLPNPTTLGVVGSLLRAMEAARGEYISILNDDDVWHPDFLKEVVSPLEADPRRVLAFSDHWIMSVTGRLDREQTETWSRTFRRQSLPNGELPNGAEVTVVGRAVPIAITAVFRKDACDWKLLAPAVAGAYDYWISCLLAATRRPIYYVARQLAGYRVHPVMESVRRSATKDDSLVFIFSELRRQGWFPEWDAFLQEELIQALFAAGRNKRDFGFSTEARKLFWRSFRLRPGVRALLCTVETMLPLAPRTWLSSTREPAASQGEGSRLLQSARSTPLK